MASVLSLIAVVVTGLYFVALAVVAFTAPARASRFLQGFASSAVMHYLELSLRIVVGLAFVTRGPAMLFPLLFVTFGWILVITTSVIFLVPWHWHLRFAQKTVPKALRHLPLVALVSWGLGALIIVAAVGGTGLNSR